MDDASELAECGNGVGSMSSRTAAKHRSFTIANGRNVDESLPHREQA